MNHCFLFLLHPNRPLPFLTGFSFTVWDLYGTLLSIRFSNSIISSFVVSSGAFVGIKNSGGNQDGLFISEYSTKGADTISSSYLS